MRTSLVILSALFGVFSTGTSAQTYTNLCPAGMHLVKVSGTSLLQNLASTCP